MQPESDPPPDADPGIVVEQRIAAAKNGDRAALDELLQSCRGYLLSIAQQEMGNDLRAKLGSSDIVQETCIKAVTKFESFRGTSQPEFFGWVRQILVNNMADTRRQFLGTDRRNVRRELGGSVARNAVEGVPADYLTPGSAVSFSEQVDAMKSALAAMPEDYRQVIMLRNWERLSFAEIGKKIGRSEDAARKLWTRAVLRLGDELS